MAELFDHLDHLKRAPGKVAVATLVNTRGTTPRKEGAKMVVGEHGDILGSVTIGGSAEGGAVENTALYERVRAHTTRGGRGAVITRLEGVSGSSSDAPSMSKGL